MRPAPKRGTASCPKPLRSASAFAEKERTAGAARGAWRGIRLGLAWFGLAATSLSAALPTSGIITAHSQGSAQFVAHGARPQISGAPLAQAQEGRVVLRLDPPLLVVTCERIKEALLHELDCPDRWRGQIEMNIRFTLNTNQPIVITSAVYADGWRGRMEIPDEVDAEKLVRAVVQVLLLEMANRNPGEGLTEIPLWLTEGMTRLLLDSAGPALAPQPNTLMVRYELKTDPIDAARARLQNRWPLTFNELSLPAPEQLTGAGRRLYENSAELFVAELLRTPNGQAKLTGMLALLPRCFNWQTAFFQAYRPQFRNPLEVEKWWALRLLNDSGRQKWRGWPPVLTSETLAEILTVPAQVRHTSAHLPLPSKVSLQTLVERWSFSVQKPILQAKISQLAALRMNAAPQLVPLVDRYRTALDTYLQQQERGGTLEPLNRGVIPVRAPLLARNLVRQLDTLDQQRAAWQRRLTGQSTPPNRS